MPVTSAAKSVSASPTSEATLPCPEQGGARPASAVRSAAIVSAAFFVSVCLTGSLAWRGGEQFAGSLTADVFRIESPASGVIEWLAVKPGQVVVPGEELFVVRDTGLSLKLASLESEIARLTGELESAQARCDLEFNTRSAAINSDVFDTELTLAGLLREQFQQTFETSAVDRASELYDALVAVGPSPISLNSLSRPRSSAEESSLMELVERASQENEREAVAARISLCESRIQDLTAGRESLQKTVKAAFGIESLKARIEDAQARADELRQQEEALTIRSPVYGMAGLTRAAEGGEVQHESLLLEVFDRDREFVEVDLPSRVASMLEAGRRVSLHFPGGDKLEGRIETVPPQVSVTDVKTDPTIPVRIRPTGKAWPTLPIGTSIGVTLAPVEAE